MAKQSWVQTVASMQAAGTQLINSTTATSILTGQGKPTLPAQWIERIGDGLRITSRGQLQNSTTACNLTLDIRMGSTVVFTTNAIPMATGAAVGPFPYELKVDLIARTVGSATACTFMGIGTLSSYNLIGGGAPTATAYVAVAVPYNAAPVVGSGFDSTVSNAIDHFATFSAANAGNGITCMQFIVESLN